MSPVKAGACLLALCITLASEPALAEITKAECIQANTNGQSLRREGRLAEAREQLRTCSAATCPSLVSADCIKRLDELESAQPTVVFEATDKSGRDENDVTVTMDGQRLVERLEGVAVNVEPGEHTLTFAVPGREPVTQKLVFREGEKSRRVRVTLPWGEVSSPTPEKQGPGSAANLPPTDTAPSGSPQRKVGWIVGGVGLAGLAVGGFFGMRTIQEKNRQIEKCESPTSCPDYASAEEAHKAAKTAGTISTIAFIAGGAATTVGIVLVLTARRSSDPEPASVSLSPRVGPSRAGLELAAHF